VCFAANSLLCRAALAGREIDPWSFTAVRIASGAAVLIGLVGVGGKRGEGRGSFLSALALYGYAGAFSLAYLSLAAGVGALVLFASVQATMLGWSAWSGARPSARELGGFALAFGGLVVLCWPGASVPEPLGLALMGAAGVAWGVYTLRGRAAGAPLVVTRDNFVRALPLALGALGAAFALGSLQASARGLGRGGLGPRLQRLVPRAAAALGRAGGARATPRAGAGGRARHRAARRGADGAPRGGGAARAARRRRSGARTPTRVRRARLRSGRACAVTCAQSSGAAGNSRS